MLNDADIKKLKNIFVTKDELRMELKGFSNSIIKGITELFNATNERIDGSNKRIDKVLLKLEEHDDDIRNHRRRIVKIEEKVYSA